MSTPYAACSDGGYKLRPPGGDQENGGLVGWLSVEAKPCAALAHRLPGDWRGRRADAWGAG